MAINDYPRFLRTYKKTELLHDNCIVINKSALVYVNYKKISAKKSDEEDSVLNIVHSIFDRLNTKNSISH
jgi:hypothetical protein